MTKAGAILGKILNSIVTDLQPGISADKIDESIERYILSSGAIPSFKNYHGYQFSSCISVNEEVVHGIPKNKTIQYGDVVGIDVGVCYQGYHADAAKTIIVGKTSTIAQKLVKITELALKLAIAGIKPNTKLTSIQNIIQQTAIQNKLSIVKNLTGHGIGKNLQEPPSIANFVDGNSIILQEGMTFCLEPMFTIGSGEIRIKNDGWTIETYDKKLAAHFEHTLLVTKKGCRILTQ